MRRTVLAVLAVAVIIGPAVWADGWPAEPSADAKGRYANFLLISSGQHAYLPIRDLGYVRDSSGVTHVLVPASNSRLGYETHAPGASGWRRHVVPGSEGDAGLLALSPNGKTLYLAAKPCPLYVISKPVSRSNFGNLKSHPPVIKNCEPEGDDTDWELRDMVALPRGRVAVLVNKAPGGTPGGMCVWVGRPGGRWTKTKITTEHAQGDQRIEFARDASTGRLYVAAVVNAAASSEIQVFSGRPQGSWSSTSLPADPGSNVTGLAAMHGQLWLAFHRDSRPTSLDQPAAPTDGVFLAHRSREGEWTAPTRPAGTTINSLNLRLLADPKDRVVHGIYVEADYQQYTGASGLYYIRIDTSGGQSQPVQLTHWWRDIPLHMAPTNHGGYRYDFQRN